MLSVSAVLFDLYGTLLTYGNMSRAFGLWHRDLARAVNALGGRVNEKSIAESCEHFFSSLSGKPGFTAYEERVSLLARKCGLSPSTAWIRKTADESMNGWQKEIPLHPEALPMLRQLHEKGIRIGVISNFEHYPHVHRVLKYTGLAPLLDATVISGEVHLKKPDPRIFQYALKVLNSPAASTLFVGDDPHKDILGARGVGMQTWLFHNGAPLAALLPLIEAI